MRIVVTGANRGIGFELTRQLLSRGDEIIATARHPERAAELNALREKYPALVIVGLDVASNDSARALPELLPGGALDGLVNNAGVTGNSGSLGKLDFDDMVATFSTNALGALRVTQALLPRLREGKGKRVLNVSTGMGSIGDNGSGGSWGYRLSKAALNMATRNLGLALATDGISVVAVNPGWVKTDMGGASATMPVEESAARLLKIFDALGPKQSGSFLNYDGSVFAW